jgi:hypothetical protein
MTRRTLAAIALAAATLTAGAAPALAMHVAPARSAKVVRLASLTAKARAKLRAEGIAGQLVEVGAVGNDHFYTGIDTAGRTCHLIGASPDSIAVTYCPASDGEVQLGITHPVIAAPFFVAPGGDQADAKLFRLVGFALPAVTRIALVAPDGALSDVPVRNGVFAEDQPEADAVALRAFGKDGSLLYEMRFR